MAKIVDYIFNAKKRNFVVKNEMLELYKNIEVIGRGSADWNEPYMQNFINLIDALDNSKKQSSDNTELKQISEYDTMKKTRVVNKYSRFKSSVPVTAKFTFYDDYDQPIENLLKFRKKSYDGSSYTDLDGIEFVDLSDWIYIDTSSDFTRFTVEFGSSVSGSLYMESPRVDVDYSDIVGAFSSNVITTTLPIEDIIDIDGLRYFIEDFTKIVDVIDSRLFSVDGIQEKIDDVKAIIAYVNSIISFAKLKNDSINVSKHLIQDENIDYVSLNSSADDIEIIQLDYADVIAAAEALVSTFDDVLLLLNSIKIRDRAYTEVASIAKENELKFTDNKIALQLVRLKTSQANFDDLTNMVQLLTDGHQPAQDEINILKPIFDDMLIELNTKKDTLNGYDYTDLDIESTVLKLIDAIKTLTVPSKQYSIGAIKAQQDINAYYVKGDNSLLPSLVGNTSYAMNNLPDIDQAQLDTLVSDVNTTETSVAATKVDAETLDTQANLMRVSTLETQNTRVRISDSVDILEKRIDVSLNSEAYYSNIDGELVKASEDSVLIANEIETVTDQVSQLDVFTYINNYNILNAAYQESYVRYGVVESQLISQSSDNVVELQSKASVARDDLIVADSKVDYVNTQADTYHESVFLDINDSTNTLATQIANVNAKVDALDFGTPNDNYSEFVNETRKTDNYKKISLDLLKKHYDNSNTVTYFGGKQIVQSGRYDIISFTESEKFSIGGDWNYDLETLVVAGGGAGGDVYHSGGGGAGKVYKKATKFDKGIYKVNIGLGGVGGNNQTSVLTRRVPTSGGDTVVCNAINRETIISCDGGGVGGIYGTYVNGMTTNGGSGGGANSGGSAAGIATPNKDGYYGNDGGLNNSYSSGGGGGSLATPNKASTVEGGVGGEGLTSDIIGTPTIYGVGGSGYNYTGSGVIDRTQGIGGGSIGRYYDLLNNEGQTYLDALGYGSGGGGTDISIAGIGRSGHGSNGFFAMRKDRLTPEDPLFNHITEDAYAIAMHHESNYDPISRTLSISANETFESVNDLNYIISGGANDKIIIEMTILGSDYKISIGENQQASYNFEFLSSSLSDTSISNVIALEMDSSSNLAKWYVNNVEVSSIAYDTLPDVKKLNITNAGAAFDIVFTINENFLSSYGTPLPNFVKFEGTFAKNFPTAFGFLDSNNEILTPNDMQTNIVDQSLVLNRPDLLLRNAIGSNSGEATYIRTGDYIILDLTNFNINSIWVACYGHPVYDDPNLDFNIFISDSGNKWTLVKNYDQAGLTVEALNSVFTTANPNAWNLAYDKNA